MIHGSYVVHHLVDIAWQVRVKELGFDGQEVLERTLRSLDLTGQDGLFPHIHKNEKVRVRQRQHRSVQPSKCAIRLRQESLKLSAQLDRRLRGKGGRDEGAIARGLIDVASSPS